MMTMTMAREQNPYSITDGYEERHYFPIVGYGLTIETIQAFLFDFGYKQELKKLDDAWNNGMTTQEIFEAVISKHWQPRFEAKTLEIVETASLDAKFLMSYSLIYATSDGTRLSTIDELNEALVNVICEQFHIVQEKDVKALQQFVEAHADIILACDYC